MEQLITIQDIVNVFKNTNEKKKLRDIKDAIVKALTPENALLNADQVEIEKQVDLLVKEDKKQDNESELVYSNGYYKKRKKKAVPADGTTLPTDYIGRAGECAVISELIFHGYNANRMMIDDGVDIIAVKDNVYYYVQVKTTNIKNGRIYAQIGIEKFDQFINSQMRYIIVARYNDKGIERNMFFLLTPSLIQHGLYGQCIKKGNDSVSIKIQFNAKTGEPMLYDTKEMSIGYFKDNFNL